MGVHTRCDHESRRGKRITIIEVAQLAGVSRQTVSRVLNKSDNVSAGTRARVLKAIQRLKYRPDSLARSLVTRRTHTLAVIARGLAYIHSRIIEGAEEYAREQGYQLFISGCDNSRFGEPLHAPLLSEQRYEGLLIVYPGSQRDRYRLFASLEEGIPIVTTGYAAEREGVTTVAIDNQEAARALTRHLVGLNHTRIAHITGPRYHNDAVRRLSGYLYTLRAEGIPVDESLIVEGRWTVDSGYAVTSRLLDEKKEFTAIFSQNDWMAIGCMKALREHGLRVPEDVALVGFDNIPPSEYIDPPLTTVNYPGNEVGRLSVRVLLERIHEGGRPSGGLSEAALARIEPKLIIRRSCGAGPRGAGDVP